MLNAIHLLACTLHRVVYAMPEGQLNDGATAYMQEFDKAYAELGSDMQTKDVPQPPLNKTDCYTPLLDIQPKQGCRVCGGTMVFIRGKYPGSDKREVCPTCAWERLEQINEMSQPNYGMAYKSNGV